MRSCAQRDHCGLHNEDWHAHQRMLQDGKRHGRSFHDTRSRSAVRAQPWMLPRLLG